MKHWASHDDDGQIRQVTSGMVPPHIDGLVHIEVDHSIDDIGAWYVLGGRLARYTDAQMAVRGTRPAGCRWSNAAMGWVDRLSDEQRRQQRADAARQRRRDLLAESDWTQVQDSPLSVAARAAWAAYRQALRDVTLQAGWPMAVVWPEPPGNAG